MQNDARLMSTAVFKSLYVHSMDTKKPLLCSLTEEFAKRGAYMSAYVDLEAIGRQAALAAQLYLEQGRSPKDIGLQVPYGVQLAVNETTGGVMGSEIPVEMRPMINAIYGAPMADAR